MGFFTQAARAIVGHVNPPGSNPARTDTNRSERRHKGQVRGRARPEQPLYTRPARESREEKMARREREDREERERRAGRGQAERCHGRRCRNS